MSSSCSPVHAVRRTIAGAAVAVGLLASAPASAQELRSGTPARDLGPGVPTVSIKTASLATAEAVAARHGVAVVRAFPWIDWYELTSPAGTTDGRDFAEVLAGEPGVTATDAVAPDEQLTPAFTPRDTAWDAAAILTTGEQAAWQLTKANFPAAWDLSTGAGAMIGIIDSEFDLTHQDLSSKFRNAWNTSSGTPKYHTGDTRAEYLEQLHGTHVAGIAGAVTDNGIGVSGAGFDALITPVRINTSFNPGTGNPIDSNFVNDLTEALGYMMGKGIGVLNMSLGSTRNHQPLADAIAALRSTGVTIVAAAGNEQQTSPNAPIYPASYPGVIAVANTQANDTLAPSSSNGAWVDVAAPGTNIFSTWETNDPQLQFPGQTANYNAISGTSMAAPLVAGLVALMKSARPDLSPDEVEMLLKGSTTDLGSAGPDPQFGAGLINAYRAVAAAKAYVRPITPLPPAPPAPTPDTTAPTVKIADRTSVKGRYVTIRFKCNEACSGKARIRTLRKALRGSRSFTGKAGTTVQLRIKTKTSFKVGSRVLVEVTAADAAKNLSTRRARRTLSR